MTDEISIGTCATLASLLEVTAPKPGNVYPGADFDDVGFADFAVSAAVTGPILEDADKAGVGATILRAVQATGNAVGTNTNLGMILLIAPLAAIPTNLSIAAGVDDVLDSLNSDDTRDVYEAIRLARPGGLGTAREADVAADAPQRPLREVMALAAERDMVARQYANGFDQVLNAAAPWIADGRTRGWRLSDAIVRAHLQLMERFPDSLIVRKSGEEIAGEAAARAAIVLQSGEPGDANYARGLADLDAWLRADERRRNPGATADLIAAGLFVLLRERKLDWPIRFVR